MLIDEKLLYSEAKKACVCIERGGLAIVPADIGYGFLGRSKGAVEKMYRLKGRSLTNPSIIAANIDILSKISPDLDRKLHEWIRQISAQTTLAVVVPFSENNELILSIDSTIRKTYLKDGNIAVFLNCGFFIEQMVKIAETKKYLLIGSSANISGYGNNYAFSDLPEIFIKEADYYFDANVMKYDNNQKLATTILNFANYTINRKGVNFKPIIDSYEDFLIRNNYPVPMLTFS